MELFYIKQNTISCELADIEQLPEEGYLWLLYDRMESFDINSLLSRFNLTLNARHLEDIKQLNHPSFYEGMADYDVLILRTASGLKDQTERRIFNSTTFIIFKKLLITVYDRENTAISKCLSPFMNDKRLPPENPAVLAELCIDQFIYQFLDLKQNIDNKLLVWQRKLLQSRKRTREEDWMGLLEFKTDVRRIKMLCEEQLDTINAWRSSLHTNLLPKRKDSKDKVQLAINLNDLAEHSARMVRVTTQSQLELDSLLQLYFTVISHRTNDVMRIIALITGIFMPANLITGIFGMNFAHIPDLASPYGFTVVLGSILSISILLLGYFRWRRWL